MRVLRLIENKIVCEHVEGFTIIEDWNLLQPDENGSINWIVESVTQDMPYENVVNSFMKSSIIWTQIFKNIGTNIVVAKTFNSNKASIKINFANNGDPRLPLPFEDGVLAYAMNNGVLWFNDKWDWTSQHDGVRIFLDAVFVHELGHNFKIDHSKVVGDIMAPYIDMESGDIRITTDTQNALAEIYSDFIVAKEAPEAPEETENNDDISLIYKNVIISLLQDIKDVNKVFLIEACEHLGISTEGKKKHIIKRLKEFFK